jgi:prepilin peptidase CpaA
VVTTLWLLAVIFSLAAAVTDFRWRRIPNWLTYPAVPIAIALHWKIAGAHAALLSLAGAALGFAILIPFLLLGGLGGGDCKLVAALGAFFEPRRLIVILFFALIVNLLMAVVVIFWNRKFGQSARNFARLTSALFLFRSPGADLTIENPQASKVPFGIAAAIAVLLYVASQQWVAF